jgi:tetratricopeptide (TPR) repeat protein
MNPTPERAAALEKRMDEIWAHVQEVDPGNPGLKTLMAWRAESAAETAKLTEEALEIDPTDLDTLRLAAQFASGLGRTNLAIRIYQYLAERNPLELWVHMGAGETYLSAGRNEDALHHLETAAILSPKTESVNWRLGLARLVAGDPEGALVDFEREPPNVYRLQGMSMALHDLGREDESATVLQELVDRENESYADMIKVNPEIVPWPFGFARAHAWMGNADEAFRYLKHTAEFNDGALEGLAKHPLFTKLHDDARWLPFLREHELAPEQLAEIDFNPRLPGDL